MAIKRINREEILNKRGAVKINQPAIEEEVPETIEEEIEEVVLDEEEEVVAEPVKVEKVVKPAKVEKVKSVKEEVVVEEEEVVEDEEEEIEEEIPAVKKSLGKKVAVNPISGKKGATVYSKEKLAKDIASKLEERFDNIDKSDAAFILKKVEEALEEALDIASVRFLGGILKKSARNASVNKSPVVDYSSYTGARSVYTLNGAEVGSPEKYRGSVSADKSKFIVTQTYDYETKKWVDAEGEIEL